MTDGNYCRSAETVQAQPFSQRAEYCVLFGCACLGSLAGIGVHYLILLVVDWLLSR